MLLAHSDAAQVVLYWQTYLPPLARAGVFSPCSFVHPQKFISGDVEFYI